MLKLTLPIMLLGLALSGTVDAAPRSYGPVKDQDTLWTIADRLRPDNRATVQQTMLALYYKNPQAFVSNNINSLMKGAVLKAPSSAEARRYQRLAALREARKHNHFWKRGVALPRTEPPPVPKIKERSVIKRSKPIGPKLRSKTSAYTVTPRNTSRSLARLQAQLQAVEAKNQELTHELKSLQAKQAQGKPNPQLDAQVKKLKLELQELTSVLDQKDNHIKTLQASLKNASETIKAQHADNMRLYDKLKEVSPSSAPTPPNPEGKSELKLTTVEASTAAVAGAAISENKDNATKSVWADEHRDSPTAATKPDNSAEKPTNETAEPDSKVSTDTVKPSESTEKTTKSADQIAESKTENATQPTNTASKTAEATGNTATGTTAASESPVIASNDSDIKAPSHTQSAAHLVPTNEVKTPSSVPVSQIISQSSQQSSTGTSNASLPLRGVSPLALAVALISLLFILALVWRAFVQQRQMRRLEEEETQVAERMRRRLEGNQSSSASTSTASVVEKKDPALDSPEIKF